MNVFPLYASVLYKILMMYYDRFQSILLSLFLFSTSYTLFIYERLSFQHAMVFLWLVKVKKNIYSFFHFKHHKLFNTHYTMMFLFFKLYSDCLWCDFQIEDDAYQEDLGFSLGQLGKSGSGRVRQAQVNDATKARISKSLQVNLHLHSTIEWLSLLPPSHFLLLCCTTEDLAEAEHDVRRKVHSQRPLLRNQLQCGVHSSSGKK